MFSTSYQSNAIHHTVVLYKTNTTVIHLGMTIERIVNMYFDSLGFRIQMSILEFLL